jgi:hypothetical protein
MVRITGAQGIDIPGNRKITDLLAPNKPINSICIDREFTEF